MLREYIYLNNPLLLLLDILDNIHLSKPYFVSHLFIPSTSTSYSLFPDGSQHVINAFHIHSQFFILFLIFTILHLISYFAYYRCPPVQKQSAAESLQSLNNRRIATSLLITAGWYHLAFLHCAFSNCRIATSPQSLTVESSPANLNVLCLLSQCNCRLIQDKVTQTFLEPLH